MPILDGEAVRATVTKIYKSKAGEAGSLCCEDVYKRQVINKGGASCQDVLDLCKYCSDTVFKEKGVKLEMEIRVTK